MEMGKKLNRKGQNLLDGGFHCIDHGNHDNPKKTEALLENMTEHPLRQQLLLIVEMCGKASKNTLPLCLYMVAMHMTSE
jgi:hypothetical protein